MGVLTEIHGLRIVTGNLLEDLERVVRHANTFHFDDTFRNQMLKA